MVSRITPLILFIACFSFVTGEVKCPDSNGSSYTTNGATFKVQCNTDHSGGDLRMNHTSTFQKCIDLCSTTTSCVCVAYSGSACYMKKSVGKVVNSSVSGAVLSSSAPSSSTNSPTTASPASTTRQNPAPTPTFGGCGQTLTSGLTPGGASRTFSMVTLDGYNRTYLLYIPKNYDAINPNPLVFSFHGSGGTSAQQEGDTRFSTTAVNPNFIAVYPQGYQNHWQGAPYSTVGVNDVSFVQEIVDKLSTSLCIDLNRVYASGHSNGGGFTFTLACDPVASLKIAAFAGNSAALYQGQKDTNCDANKVDIKCNSGRILPVLEIHGTSDGQIPYPGGAHNGECLPAIPYYVNSFALRDNLSPTNLTTPLSGGHVMYQWGKTVQGKVGVVTHVMVNGGGHWWPTNFNNFSASPVVMDFFNKWTLDSKF